MEMSFNIVFFAMNWFLLPHLGLLVAAIAFMVACLVCFNVAYILARRIHGFRWQGLSLRLLALHGSLALTLLGIAQLFPIAAAIASPLLSLVTGLFGLRVVLIKMGPEGQVATRLYRLYAAIGWPLRSIS